MFQTPEITIIKQKYSKINIQHNNNGQKQNGKSFQKQIQCFTPILKINKNQTQATDSLRKTDKIQPIANKIYDFYIKNNQNSFNPLQNPYNPTQKTQNSYQTQNSKHEIYKQNNSQKQNANLNQYKSYLTPQKLSLTNKYLNSESTDVKENKQQKQFLYINSPFQSYSSPLDNDNPQSLFLNNVQSLKYHLNRAKQQSDRLKDENLKLRLQKVKLKAKSSNNQSLKIIPLKIEYQNLKKNIQKLIQQKQILELSLKKKIQNQNQINSKINPIKTFTINKIDGQKVNNQGLQIKKIEQFVTPNKRGFYQNHQSSTLSSGYTNNSNSDSKLIQNSNNYYSKNDNIISNVNENNFYNQQGQYNQKNQLSFSSPGSQKNKIYDSQKNKFYDPSFQLNNPSSMNQNPQSSNDQNNFKNNQNNHPYMAQNSYSNSSFTTNNRDFFKRGNDNSINKNSSYSGSSLTNANKRPVLYKNQILQYPTPFSLPRNNNNQQLNVNYKQGQNYARIHPDFIQTNQNNSSSYYNTNYSHINNVSNIHSPRNV